MSQAPGALLACGVVPVKRLGLVVLLEASWDASQKGPGLWSSVP